MIAKITVDLRSHSDLPAGRQAGRSEAISIEFEFVRDCFVAEFTHIERVNPE
jgi:hypothetical protein